MLKIWSIAVGSIATESSLMFTDLNSLTAYSFIFEHIGNNLLKVNFTESISTHQTTVPHN